MCYDETDSCLPFASLYPPRKTKIPPSPINPYGCGPLSSIDSMCVDIGSWVPPPYIPRLLLANELNVRGNQKGVC